MSVDAILPIEPGHPYKGVRVRGGGKVDIAWKEGRLTELKLQSNHAVKYRISYGAHSAEVQIQPGKPTLLDNTLRGIAFRSCGETPLRIDFQLGHAVCRA